MKRVHLTRRTIASHSKTTASAMESNLTLNSTPETESNASFNAASINNTNQPVGNVDTVDLPAFRAQNALNESIGDTANSHTITNDTFITPTPTRNKQTPPNLSHVFIPKKHESVHRPPSHSTLQLPPVHDLPTPTHPPAAALNPGSSTGFARQSAYTRWKCMSCGYLKLLAVPISGETLVCDACSHHIFEKLQTTQKRVYYAR
jgi:DNA-directed RNA polymerase subunit RPC12/RpoP